MIIVIDAEITIDKIQHHFMIKSLKKEKTGASAPHIIKAISDKPIARITLNGEKVKAFFS
jgi:hypothetical protein